MILAGVLANAFAIVAGSVANFILAPFLPLLFHLFL
jgi:hypothetical protein